MDIAPLTGKNRGAVAEILTKVLCSCGSGNIPAFRLRYILGKVFSQCLPG